MTMDDPVRFGDVWEWPGTDMVVRWLVLGRDVAEPGKVHAVCLGDDDNIYHYGQTNWFYHSRGDRPGRGIIIHRREEYDAPPD